MRPLLFFLAFVFGWFGQCNLDLQYDYSCRQLRAEQILKGIEHGLDLIVSHQQSHSLHLVLAYKSRAKIGHQKLFRDGRNRVYTARVSDHFNLFHVRSFRAALIDQPVK